MRLNESVAAITPSVTLAITSRARQMAAQGRTVFSFGAGEPDFDTPEPIKAAAAAALGQGQTKYAPTPGLPALREAIARKLARENGLAYRAEQIVVSNGAKHSLFNVFLAVCREGDEVLIPSPYWLSYPEMVTVAGGKPVFVEGREEDGFKISAEQLDSAVTARTRAIVLNSPSNPTGLVYSRAEIEALVETALAHDLLIVADEIYEKILYDGAQHVSPGSLSQEALDHTVTVNGFSKTFAMTGWRLGYLAAPEPIAKAVTAIQSHSTSGANTFAQFGAIAALEGGTECVDRMLRAFSERRTLLYDRLQAIEGVTCVKPMGAFYMLPNIGRFGLDSVPFAERLLDQEGVAVVPGAPFGADRTVRLSYACSTETIERGLDGLARFTASLA